MMPTVALEVLLTEDGRPAGAEAAADDGRGRAGDLFFFGRAAGAGGEPPTAGAGAPPPGADELGEAAIEAISFSQPISGQENVRMDTWKRTEYILADNY